ncbi:MAG TPA: hypothetical protein VMU54_20825 [Planctomycetota bacterium]|nr:hypothetical protein [Planctomycetota bacterium]
MGTDDSRSAVIVGTLVQRAGWGGQAGAVFAFLSGNLAVFCAGMLVLAGTRGRRL